MTTTTTTSTSAGADLTSEEFRRAVGHFATGVTVVTSVGPDGQPVGTTANAVSSLSLDPPLILVCFDRASLTLEAIRSHGAFVVNVLAAPQQELSANFARRGLEAAWEGVEHAPGPDREPAAGRACSPRSSAPSSTACPGVTTRSSSGRLRYAETSADDAAPLLFWRGSYMSLDDA